MAWLDRNNFSREWQDAFRNLNIHGMDFLEIGQRYSPQLHQAILPEVLRLYGQNADPDRESKVGKKIKSLVREIMKLGQNAPAVPLTPSLGNVPMSPAYSEDAPGKGFIKGSGRAKPNATRRATLSETYDNPSGQSDPRASAELQPRAAPDQQIPTRRSEYSKSALGGMNIVRGQSPSSSVASLHHGGNSQGPYASSSRGLQDSPQSSPSPSYQNMPGRHAKTNSQESIASSVYKDGSRWTIVDNNQKADAKPRNHGRPSTSHEKESSSKFGMKSIFSRRSKTRDDDSHDDIESPSSPSFRENTARLEKQVPNLPFIHEHNHSDSSIATASTVSEQERTLRRPGHRQASSSGVSQEKLPLRVFTTTNLKHFALVDLTELESPDAIRKALCLSVNIPDWEMATIYQTEVGQTNHEECLSDNMLSMSRRRADDKATVKFYIELPVATLIPTNIIQPPMSAQTQSVFETRQYPVNGITRKPISLEPNSATARRQSRQPSSNFSSHVQTGQQHEYQNKQVEKMLEKKQEPPGSDSLDDLLGRLNDFKTRQDAGALPEGPKIDITGPRSPIAVPAGPRPSVQPTPIDPDVDLMYNSTIGVWESYENNGSKVQKRSPTESSPIEFNPSEDVSRDELFFGGHSSTYISDPNQQSSGFKVVVDQYQKKREIELEKKRRKDQGLRLQQQTGFSKINSPDKKVIDFDNPRASPFEDKSFEHMIPHPLVPHRKPPPPPAETLSRSSIGSLSKKGVDTFRKQYAETSGYVGTTRKNSIVRRQEMREQGTIRKAVPPVHTEGAGSFVSSRRMSIQEHGPFVMPGDNVPSSQPFAPQQGREMPSIDSVSASGSPHTVVPPTHAGYGWGQQQEFTVPDYQPGAAEKLSVVIPNQYAPGSPAPVSPGDEVRKGFEEVQFVDNEITFMPTPHIPQEEDDDSDSDDGLFAIPLTGKTTKPKDTPPSSDSGSGGSNTNESQKPALTLSTKGVTFRATPITSAVGGSTTGSTPSSLKNTEFHEGDDKHLIYSPAVPSPRSTGPSVHSPADYPINRPTSFIDEDWASRPAPETLIDNLDELFPNLDLDQPLIDDSAVSSPPPSPSPATERPRYNLSSSALPLPGDDMPVVSAVKEEDEDNILMPENPTMKTPRPPSVAVRNVGRYSGGLGRMKSIREVARGAHERGKRLAQQQQPVGNDSTTGGMDKQAMLRRKSTKLFGARLIEVKPGQGRRELRQMQMQEPQSQLPKRQATFKWFKGPLIGKGTYGRVYLGMNATTGDFLAVKQVEVNKHASNGDSELLKEMIAALNQEIETMQHLDHINIVQYLGCERKEMSISIFLEYIPGGSIGSCLRKHGKFDEPIVRSLTRQTLSGLEYLHREGILHRDLKADNILLDKTGTCKISDFGISKKSENIYGNDPGNSMQGSVFWMAPEVIRPEGQGYSAKIDIWSLGCVVLEMFAGRRPWSKEEAIGAIYKLGSERIAPPIPDDVGPYISPAAIAFLADCHTIEPAERPTARTLLDGHPFCAFDPMFDFRTTTLYELVQDTKERPVPVPVQPKYQ